MATGISLGAPEGIEANFPLNYDIFHTRELRAVDVDEEVREVLITA